MAHERAGKQKSRRAPRTLPFSAGETSRSIYRAADRIQIIRRSPEAPKSTASILIRGTGCPILHRISLLQDYMIEIGYLFD